MSGFFSDDVLEFRPGKKIAVPQNRIIGDYATVSRTVKGTPEVVVKIVSNCKDVNGLSGMIAYVSRTDAASIRDGLAPIGMEDERGNLYVGVDDRKDAVSTWKGIPANNGTRREAFHIVWSMPPETDPEAVKDSVRRVAAVEFQRFQYVFARHDDTDQSHIHLVVHATPFKGKRRLSPGRYDLQRWRESFADNLRQHHGIEANATPREARFETRYSKSSNQLQRDIRVSGDPNTERRKHVKPDDVKKLKPIFQRVYKEYSDMAVALNKGSTEDRLLAEEINRYTYSKVQRVQEHSLEQ